MATIQQIITRSMRLIGAVEAGETPTTDELNDCLTALQSMLGGWRTSHLTTYAFLHETFTFVPGQGTYTIGAAADFVTTRPLKIYAAYTRDAGIDYPMSEADMYQWSALSDKSTGADYPSWFYYEATYPLGTFKVNPVPEAAHTVVLVRRSELDDSFALADTFDFPPGYERAITYNLAVEIAPEFEAQVSDIVMGIAAVSRGDIQRANNKSIKSVPEFTLRGGRDYDVVSDV